MRHWVCQKNKSYHSRRAITTPQTTVGVREKLLKVKPQSVCEKIYSNHIRCARKDKLQLQCVNKHPYKGRSVQRTTGTITKVGEEQVIPKTIGWIGAFCHSRRANTINHGTFSEQTRSIIIHSMNKQYQSWYIQ